MLGILIVMGGFIAITAVVLYFGVARAAHHSKQRRNGRKGPATVMAATAAHRIHKEKQADAGH